MYVYRVAFVILHIHCTYYRRRKWNFFYNDGIYAISVLDFLSKGFTHKSTFYIFKHSIPSSQLYNIVYTLNIMYETV